MADETTDVSNKSILSVCIRYIHPQKKTLVERMLKFYHLKDQSAKGIKKTIMEILSPFLNSGCRIVGQSYDGANVMAGVFGGVQKLVILYFILFPTVVYIYYVFRLLMISLMRFFSIALPTLSTYLYQRQSNQVQ